MSLIVSHTHTTELTGGILLEHLTQGEHGISPTHFRAKNEQEVRKVHAEQHGLDDLAKVYEELQDKEITDRVNHPQHYNQHPSGIECIDVIEWFTLNVGNCIKYLWRAGLKDISPEVEDLKKARWYLDREIKRLEKVNGSSS